MAKDVITKSIERDKRRLRKRLSAKEYDCLMRGFKATGCVDLYGTLEEYLTVIAQILEYRNQKFECICDKIKKVKDEVWKLQSSI